MFGRVAVNDFASADRHTFGDLEHAPQDVGLFDRAGVTRPQFVRRGQQIRIGSFVVHGPVLG
jgi:hypothetical protein